MTIIVPEGSFEATIPAASATHGAVSRGAGSATTFRAGSSGNWSRVASAWSAPVMMKTRSGGTRCSTRATVCWSIVDSPASRSNCLGRSRRLRGQNRVPLPPAMMIACNIVSLADEIRSGHSTEAALSRVPDLLNQVPGPGVR